jgi:hypothetical protein
MKISALLGIQLSLLLTVPAIAQTSADVNLSLMTNRAIPSASDSIEGDYTTMAGAFADDNADTAWVTGRDMQDHWAQVEWHNTAVTINRVDINFAPFTLKYTPQKMFGERVEPGAVAITTVKASAVGPGALELQALLQNSWKTVYVANINSPANLPIAWEGDKATVRFAQPLTGVTKFRLRLSGAGPDESFGVRELQIWGPKPPSSFDMRPKWKAGWMWGEPEPMLATFGVVRRHFRRSFSIPDPTQIRSARIVLMGHDRARAWLNGQQIAHTSHTGSGMTREVARVDISPALFKKGQNLLALEGEDVDEVGLRGVLVELWIEKRDGTFEVLASEPDKFQVSSYDRPGWNTASDGFTDWPQAQRIGNPNLEVSWGWSADYTPAYFSGAVQVTGVELSPAIPREGEAFQLRVGVKATEPLDDAYGLLADYGDAGPTRANFVNFSRGEGFIRPEAGLPKGFQGEKTLTLSGVWTQGVTPRLPISLRFVNPKKQLQVVPGSVGQVTTGEQPGRLRVELGAPAVKYAKAGFPDAKIPQGGRLSIDGEIVSPILFSSSLQNSKHDSIYLQSGVKLFRIVPQGAGNVVPDDGEEEIFFERLLSSIRVQAEAIHSVNPDAKFILFLELDMPQDWKFEHPEEIIVLGNGSRFQPLKFRNPSTGYIQETPNSPAVIEKATRALRQFVAKLEKQPYASSVFGIALTHGRAGENYWGVDINLSLENGEYRIAQRPQYVWGDFGISARRSFRNWLQRRYKTKENLARAWKVSDIDFEDIVNPVKWPIRRFMTELMWLNRPTDRFMFRDRTAEGGLFHDFAQHMNESRAELFIEAGKAIKEVSGNKLLVGGYIGYVVPALTNSPPGSAQHSGHLAMRNVLATPYIDMMFSPHFYHMRRQGDPIMPMGITDSLRAHNKLWINEYDSRSFLSPITPKTFSQRETLEVFQKEFGNAITRDQGWWWLEFNFNVVGKDAPAWFGDEKMLEDIAVMRRVYDKYISLPAAGPEAEIAVFVNVEQPYYTDAHAPANTVHSNLVNYFIPRLSMLGAPFDIYAQADLAKLKERGWLKNYKMVIFLNAFHMDAIERGIVESELKKDGKSLLFLFAPGYQGNEAPQTELSVAGIEAVTGIKGVRKVAKKHLLGLSFNDNPIVKDVKEKEFDAVAWWSKEQIENYGNEIGPTFYLDQASGNNWTPLATLRLDKKGDATKVAMAQLKTAAFTSYYSVVPDLPAEVLSSIAKQSGVYLYARPGVLTWANNRFLTVHTGRVAKQVVLKSKKPVTWVEPFEKKVYARNTETLTIDLSKGETKFFCLENNGEWQSLLQ